MDGFQKRWKSWRNRTASNCEGHKKDTAGSGRLPERGNGAKVLGISRPIEVQDLAPVVADDEKAIQNTKRER